MVPAPAVLSLDTHPFRVGALRSALLSRLTGLTVRQVQYWHRTGLISAHTDPGARGYPRLYTWVDYMKLREAAKLSSRGVPTATIRRAVDYLEVSVPDWHLVALRVEGKGVIAHLSDLDLDVTVTRGGQIPLVPTLHELHHEGPLGELRRFDDAVDMHPRIRGGAPILKETRIETSFVRGLRNLGQSEEDIAEMDRLPVHKVQRALEFERAIA